MIHCDLIYGDLTKLFFSFNLIRTVLRSEKMQGRHMDRNMYTVHTQ